MQGLSPELIQALTSGRRIKSAQGTGAALVRTKDGLAKVPSADLEIPGFHGKRGSMRRSRKGRTYPLPNGSRRQDYNDRNIVMYPAKKA